LLESFSLLCLRSGLLGLLHLFNGLLSFSVSFDALVSLLHVFFNSFVHGKNCFLDSLLTLGLSSEGGRLLGLLRFLRSGFGSQFLRLGCGLLG